MDAANILQTALLGSGMLVSGFTAYLASRAKSMLLETKLELKADIADIRIQYGKATDIKELTERVTAIAIGCAACAHPAVANMLEKRLDRLEHRDDTRSKADLDRAEEKST